MSVLEAYAEKIRKKYRTSDPFELAQAMGIMVLYEPLGSIKGYFNTAFRQRFVHINQSLDEQQQRLTMAHEMGHVLLHPKTNTYFLRTNTRFSVGSFEYEANAFAACFLISREMIEENREYTVGQMAAMFGIPEDWMQLRLELLEA